jgi:CHAT domain-containing protein
MTASDHPQLELLGAFLEGNVKGAELDALVEHLSSCNVCIGLLRGARAAANDTSMALHFRRRPRLLVAACVVVAALGGAVAHQIYRHLTQPQGVDALIAAADGRYRTIEPRLAGFRWAELRHLRDDRGPRTDEEGLRLAGAAGEVLREAEGDDSAGMRRAAGLASLLVRETDRATKELRAATERDGGDAAAWNDLAAALYTGAVQERRAADLPQALAAAERAVHLDPSLPEARFNRALILERMGLKVEAAAAWQESLALDASSAWATEARRHLAGLRTGPGAQFRDRIPQIETAAAAGDLAIVEAQLREFPYETRGWFETDVLGRWGEAETRGDHAIAEPLLAGARTVGAVLRASSGESLLADAVATIDNAGRERRALLARGHATYRRARLAYRDQKLSDAERELLTAATAFDAGDSPMNGLAVAYAAAVIFDQNRIAEATAMVEPVASRGGSHIALLAQASALLGRCHAYSCRWSDALRYYETARTAFGRIAEPSNVAEAENALGEIYSNAGDVEKAWRHRLAALQILGDGRYGTRLLAALATDARGELRAGRWDSAQALLRLEIAEAQRGGDPLLVADAYKRRARLNVDRGATEDAAADLREARGFASRAADSGLRARVEAECALVDGVVERNRDGKRSIAQLTAAIDFARASGDRRLLPEALLERALTYRALKRLDEAWLDLSTGIDEVDDRRGTAEGGPGATLDASSALFDEAIDLLLARGQSEQAFAYAERARARALLDALDSKVPARPGRSGIDEWVRPGATAMAASLPAGTTLIEYALLPRSVAIFRVTSAGLRVTRQPIERFALEADVREMRAQIEAGASLDRILPSASRLHSLLIAPLGEDGADSLVIVGDRVLQSVPWPALWDAGRREYLVERYSLSVAPSAGVWLRNRSRLQAAMRDDQLLLVTSDLRSELDPLDDLRREARAIQGVYLRHSLLTDAEVTPSRFLSAAADSDIVHYAGHARASSDVREAALLLGGGEELTASRIAQARLLRTRLVVLAACSTLAGDTSGLEGSPGLARAFLAAGVPTVVGTRWPIHDAHAATLFAAFHEHLRAGRPAARALREAQLNMLRGPTAENAHPSAWAAAEVLGAGH